MLTKGNRNECPCFEPLLDSVRLGRGQRRRPARVAADKAYASGKIRRSLKRRRIQAVIPLRNNEYAKGPPAFDKGAYRRRNVIERCVGRLKEFRRVATRFEKLAVNYSGMVSLAMLLLWIRAES